MDSCKTPLGKSEWILVLGCKFLTPHCFTMLIYKDCSIEKGIAEYEYNREISLHVQRRIRVDVGLVFGVKINPYLKIKYTFEIFHQPAVKL